MNGVEKMEKYSDGIEGLSVDFGELLYDYYLPRWRPTIPTEDAKKMLAVFLDTYGKNYSEKDLAYIKSNFHNYYSLFGADTRLGQLYSLFGCYPSDADPYLGFANVLQKYFDIRTDILDVASGHYPSFGKIVAGRQMQLGCGTITLYDPNIVCAENPPYPNMKVYKEKFQDAHSISDFRLVTSTLPCTVTKELLEQFVGTDQDLFMALCGCYGHENDFRLFENAKGIRLYDAVTRYAIDLCKKRGKGEILVDKLDDSYNIGQPILIYKANK